MMISQIGRGVDCTPHPRPHSTKPSSKTQSAAQPAALTQQQEGDDDGQRDGEHSGGGVEGEGEERQPDHEEARGVPGGGGWGGRCVVWVLLGDEGKPCG